VSKSQAQSIKQQEENSNTYLLHAVHAQVIYSAWEILKYTETVIFCAT